MMALQAPFAHCNSYASVVSTVLSSGPLQGPPGYSQDVSTTLQSLMAHNPEERPTNAQLLSSGVLRPIFQALVKAVAEAVPERAATRATVTPESDEASYK